jgi:anti-sigma regulatory factor (Ser/Thr protein kinase)
MVTEAGSGVSVRMAADELAVPVAAKVAAGAIEALHLAFGPGRRLTAIALEATRNVVDHAYTNGSSGGAVELTIASDPDAGTNGDSPGVHVHVRDYGNGCPLEPTSSDPPGLGLSIMSELSEELQIKSRRDGGTEIDAVIRTDGPPEAAEPPPEATPPEAASEMRFGDPTFLSAVLPRTIAAHAAAMGASIDAVEGSIRVGDAISRSIADYPELPAVRVLHERGALRVQIGPVGADAGNAIRSFLEPELGFEQGPDLETRESFDPTGFILVTVTIPLQ